MIKILIIIQKKKKISRVFSSFFHLTNRFYVAVRLFMITDDVKCGKNKEVAHEPQVSVSLMFLPHFGVICDLLLKRRTVTWNLFVKQKKTRKADRSFL